MDERARLGEQERCLRAIWQLWRRGQGTHTFEDAVVAVSMRGPAEFPLLHTSGEHGCSQIVAPTIRRWLKTLGTTRCGVPDWSRMAKLASKRRKGNKRISFSGEWLSLFLKAYGTQNKMGVRPAMRLATFEFKRLRREQGRLIQAGEIPTVDQVDYYLKNKVDPVDILRRRMTKKEMDDGVIASIMRDWSEVPAGYCWFGDTHTFDCWVRYTCPKSGTEICGRPKLVAWMDARSHYFVGWRITVEEEVSHLAIMESVVIAMGRNRMTPPPIFYIDNGKDFVKQGWFSPVSTTDNRGRTYEHSVLRELGSQDRRGLPFNARTKVIERRFKDICAEFSKYWISYTGNCPDNRPEYVERLRKEQPEAFPRIERFEELFEMYMTEMYHAEPKRKSRILGGKSPQEVWDARPKLREPMTIDQLWQAMLIPVGTRQVRTGSRIEVSVPYIDTVHNFYEAGDPEHFQELTRHFGGNILVKVFPWPQAALAHGREYVFACHLDGRMICPLRHVPLMHALTDGERAARMTAGYRLPYRLAQQARRLSIGTSSIFLAPSQNLQLTDSPQPVAELGDPDLIVPPRQVAIRPAAPIELSEDDVRNHYEAPAELTDRYANDI